MTGAGESRQEAPLRAPRALWILIAVSLAVRVALAWLVPLGVDENYAVAVARGYSWSFFDHPPLGFWLPVAMADLTGIEHRMIYRLPALVFFALSSWAFWRIGARLGGPVAGIWSAALLNLSPIAVVGAGMMVVPDVPLLLALSGLILCLLAILRQARPEEAPLGLWAGAGGFLALAMASKYHAVLIALGFLLWALAVPSRRVILARRGFWIAAGIGMTGFVPVLLWNIAHDWASLAFHGGRTAGGIHPLNFLRMVLGQALYLLPPTLVLAAIGLWRALRDDPAGPRGMLAAMALPPILVFSAVYLSGSQSFPHWTMPGWMLALPLAAVWIAATARRRRLAALWTGGVAAVMALILGTLAVQLRTGFLSRGADPLPAWDRTLDAFPWEGLAPALAARGLMTGADTILVAADWMDAGAMSTALAGRHPVRVLAGNMHHFPFLPGFRATGEALLLYPARVDDSGAGARALALAQEVDPGAIPLDPVVLARGGRDYAQVIVVRLVLD